MTKITMRSQKNNRGYNVENKEEVTAAKERIKADLNKISQENRGK